MRLRAIPVLLVGVLLLSPLTTFAASATFFGPIVPAECHCDNQTIQGSLDKTNSGGGTVSTAPDYGCVLQVIQNLINAFVTLSIILTTIYLVITGASFIGSGSSSEARTKAKNRFTNVFVGLAVLLMAWLLVDYVMKQLYSGAGLFGPWNSILASESSTDHCIIARVSGSIASGVVDVATQKISPGSTNGATVTPGQTSSTVLTDQQTRNKLTSAGITIAGISAAQNMANTREDTVNQVIQIKNECNCNVQVNATTGGTHASGQYSHAAGYKVDIQPNAVLDSLLKGLTPAGSRSDGTSLYKDSCGNEYARESSHWDITVSNGVCKI